MNANKQDIAIILFSRSAQQESKEKNFSAHNSKGRNFQVSRRLQAHTLEVIQKSGMDYYLHDETQQIESSFGGKISGAFLRAFDLGYQSVIIVGNDCPDIDQVDWTSIARDLKNGKSVIGPDNRHGAYLIGCNVDQFDAGSISNIRWQSSHTEEDLITYFESVSEVEILDRKSDINHISDIANVLQKGAISSLVRRLLSIIDNLFRTFAYIYNNRNQRKITRYAFGLKAPPAYL